jgi:hypothetical protein
LIRPFDLIYPTWASTIRRMAIKMSSVEDRNRVREDQAALIGGTEGFECPVAPGTGFNEALFDNVLVAGTDFESILR